MSALVLTNHAYEIGCISFEAIPQSDQNQLSNQLVSYAESYQLFVFVMLIHVTIHSINISKEKIDQVDIPSRLSSLFWRLFSLGYCLHYYCIECAIKKYLSRLTWSHSGLWSVMWYSMICLYRVIQDKKDFPKSRTRCSVCKWYSTNCLNFTLRLLTPSNYNTNRRGTRFFPFWAWDLLPVFWQSLDNSCAVG